MSDKIQRLWPWLVLVALLLLTWLAYNPGLAGGFLFDDFINLPALGESGPVDNWATFSRYVTSGTADPIGRPLSLLSFLINARDWPAEPYSFLCTNLIIHLINGALLFALLRALGHRLTKHDATNDAAALLGAGLWLLHPLFISTTLYIVQREAMLPATFTLLGLLAYIHGRSLYAEKHKTKGLTWMVLALGLGTLLALLSKANGILLPLLTWVLEVTVLKKTIDNEDQVAAPDRTLLLLQRYLLILPSLAIFLYAASFLPHLATPLDFRPWTVGQRLLTEPRVLVQYLDLLIVPRAVSTGLYNDAYTVSTDLFQPVSTLGALVAVFALWGLAVRLRHRAAALSAALLFFFAGHLLESSVVPLELYFEHRNYLPAMLLFWPLSRWLCALRVAVFLRISLCVAMLTFVGSLTYQRAQMWSQQGKQAVLWAKTNPKSARAQATAAMWEIQSHRPDLAILRLQPLWRASPYNLQYALNYANALCESSGITEPNSLRITDAIRHASAGLNMLNEWLNDATDSVAKNDCKGLSHSIVERWITAAAENPQLIVHPVLRQNIEFLQGRLALQEGDPNAALQHFDRALLAYITPSAAAKQAATLASSGEYELALAHLDTYERVKKRMAKPELGMSWLHAKVLDWQDYWPAELTQLRSKLRREIAISHHPDTINGP